MLLAECTTCHSKACLDPGSESQAGSHLPFRIGLLQLGNGVQELFGPKLSNSPWFLRSELGFGWNQVSRLVHMQVNSALHVLLRDVL